MKRDLYTGRVHRGSFKDTIKFLVNTMCVKDLNVIVQRSNKISALECTFSSSSSCSEGPPHKVVRFHGET